MRLKDISITHTFADAVPNRKSLQKAENFTDLSSTISSSIKSDNESEKSQSERL